jgi:hypothetical protein
VSAPIASPLFGKQVRVEQEVRRIPPCCAAPTRNARAPSPHCFQAVDHHGKPGSYSAYHQAHDKYFPDRSGHTLNFARRSTHSDGNELSRSAIQSDFRELPEAAMAVVRPSKCDNPDRPPLPRIHVRSRARRLERDVPLSKLNGPLARDVGRR